MSDLNALNWNELYGLWWFDEPRIHTTYFKREIKSESKDLLLVPQ